MTENQKLREGFEAYITDNGKWPNAILKAPGGQYLLLRTSVAWQDWKACAEALALPTAAPLSHKPGCPADGGYGNGPEPCICGAAPVGEREAIAEAGFNALEARGFRVNHSDIGTDDLLSVFDAMQARAALSAGDAVDGPLIDEGSKPTLVPLTDKQIDKLIHTNHFDPKFKLRDSDKVCLNWYRLGLRDGERAHGIDAAMRKAKT